MTESYEVGKYRFLIEPDTLAPNPIEFLDFLSTVQHFEHKRQIGHEFAIDNPIAKANIAVFIPIFLTIHSGTILTKYPVCRNDTSYAGVLIITKESVVDCYGDLSEESIKKAESIANEEFEILRQYYEGKVYTLSIYEKIKTYGHDSQGNILTFINEVHRESIKGMYGMNKVKSFLIEQFGVEL